MKVVSDFIALARINELELLHHIFGSIIIPHAVYREVVFEGAERPGMMEVKEAPWITTTTFVPLGNATRVEEVVMQKSMQG